MSVLNYDLASTTARLNQPSKNAENRAYPSFQSEKPLRDAFFIIALTLVFAFVLSWLAYPGLGLSTAAQIAVSQTSSQEVFEPLP